jgi:hypothetical protein
VLFIYEQTATNVPVTTRISLLKINQNFRGSFYNKTELRKSSHGKTNAKLGYDTSRNGDIGCQRYVVRRRHATTYHPYVY